MDVSDAGHQSSYDQEVGTPTYSRRSSSNITRKSSWGTPILPPSSQEALKLTTDSSETFDDIDLAASGNNSVAIDPNNPWNTLENITELGLSFSADEEHVQLPLSIERFSLDGAEARRVSSYQPLLPFRPFGKWVKTLQRRNTFGKGTVSDTDGAALGQDFAPEAREETAQKHKKSSSGSSLGFVTAVKSASISLASFSIAPHSRKTAVSSRYQRTERGSKASNTGVRLSEDSSYLVRGAVNDEAVTKRAIHRRQILEEIISTEESYVADIRFLMNVC
jgi:hypothetical protein